MKYPERLHLELTTYCNLSCIYCSNKYLKKNHVHPSVIETIINELIPHCKEIEMQGTGESLLYPDFKKVLLCADRYNCKKIIISNGMLLDNSILNLLIDTNSQIVVSIDGVDEQTYQSHRPKGNFKQIVENLTNWKKIKNTKNNTEASLIVHMTITKNNFLQISEMLKMIDRLNLDGLFVSTVRKGYNPLDVWEEISVENLHDEIAEQIHISKNLSKEFGLYFGTSFLYKKGIKANNSNANCPAPWRHLYVSAHGDIFPCCQFKESMGNLKDTEFNNIWSGDKYIELRNSFTAKVVPKECKECVLPWGWGIGV